MFKEINSLIFSKKSIIQSSIGLLFLFLLSITSCIPVCTTSETVLLENRTLEKNYIKTENNKVSVGSVNGPDKNAIWQLDCIDQIYFTIKKQGTEGATSQYFHTKSGPLQYSSISKSDLSAHWKKTKVEGSNHYRIENRLRQGQFLSLENNAVVTNSATASQKSAHWAMVSPSDLHPSGDMLEVDFLGIGYDAVRVDPENMGKNSVNNGSLEAPAVFNFAPGNKTFSVKTSTGEKEKNIPIGVIPKAGENKFSWSNKARWTLNASDYQNSFSQTYSGNIGVPDVASITLSTSFKDVEKTTSSREAAYVYKDGSYSGHNLTLDLPSLRNSLTDQFKNAVASLGTSETNYDNFISSWGTHFSTDNTMGAKCSYRFTLSKSSFSNSTENEQDFKIGVEASIEGIKGGFGAGTTHSQATSAKNETKANSMTFISYGASGVDDNFDEWSKAAQDNQTIIDLRLASYLVLFNKNFFPNDNQINAKYTLLNSAIKRYYKKNNYTEGGNPLGFFKKGPRKFTVTISRIYAQKGKAGDDTEERYYGGVLNLGVYDKLGNSKEVLPFMNLDGHMWYDAGKVEWLCNCLFLKGTHYKTLNKSFDITLNPGDLSGTFATITGNMTQTWRWGTDTGQNSMGNKVAFETAIGETILLSDIPIGETKSANVTYTNTNTGEGDVVQVLFNVKRTQ